MKVSILGLGAFGIAMAKAFYANHNKVSMWTKFQEEVDIVTLKRENIALFPGVKIPKNIDISCDIKKCIKNADIIVIAIPIGAVREVSTLLYEYITRDQIICITSKGIEQKTGMFINEVVTEITKSKNVCILSGPSFAIDIAKEKETALTVASNSDNINNTLRLALESSRIIIESSSDVRGVEICSSVKNVFAILLGIIDGMKKSESTRAAIFTTIINDIKEILSVLGANESTIFSYAGIGDLLLTCMSDKSRNYRLGKYIGNGETLEDALRFLDAPTVEGIYTLDEIIKNLKEKNVNIKSLDLIYNIIYRNIITEDILNEIK